MLREHIGLFWIEVRARLEARHAPGRLKQWLNLLRRRFGQAEALFQHVRPLRDARQIDRLLALHGIGAPALAA